MAVCTVDGALLLALELPSTAGCLLVGAGSSTAEMRECDGWGCSAVELLELARTWPLEEDDEAAVVELKLPPAGAAR